MDPNADGFIHFEYGHSDNAVEDMRNQTKNIASTLTTLETELGELKATWSGDDAKTYGKKQAAWDAALATMQGLLDSHAGLLDDISAHYKHTENNLTNLWSEVKIGR